MPRRAGVPWLALLASVTACTAPPQSKAEAPPPTPVERGRYLVTILTCNDCHTPLEVGPRGPQPDMKRLLSGHPETLQQLSPPAPVGPWTWMAAATNTAFAGPWGISYASNLTPDPNTGLGVWTEEMFLKAMRTGRHMGTSRPIQPPMPWPSYAHMTDDDLKAVFAYLRSVPALANRVPEYQEPAPPK